MPLRSIRFVTTLAVILAFAVVMLGAYTRLTDAGLGCPDWPGCYGHMVLPSEQHKLITAQSHYPQLPIESRKAWTEMAHRYAAGSLAFLIFAIGFLVVRRRLQGDVLPWRLPLALIFLVLFQAALGMWTVTLKLLPVVVMGHLLGGVLIFACLCYFRAQLSDVVGKNLSQWRFWIGLGILIVFCQIALGGWVSSNYAGVACVGFPRCNGQWWPALHFSQGFHILSPVGANYQGGVLDNSARITIQLIHRLGALVTMGYVFLLSLLLFLNVKTKSLQIVAVCALIVVILQFCLGVLNVVYLLPLSVAVAHNGGAALLLATMFVMRYLATGGAHRAKHE